MEGYGSGCDDVCSQRGAIGELDRLLSFIVPGAEDDSALDE